MKSITVAPVSVGVAAEMVRKAAENCREKKRQTPRFEGGDTADSQPKSWPAVRRQPIPVEHGEKTGNRGTAELHAYYSEGWWTAEGARLKARRLQQAGLPNFTNWRFITLTVAIRGVPPAVAYQRGKDRMRRFLARVRKAIGRAFRWCWKLEFHEDGYAHWHLLLEYLKRIPPEMLAEMETWWGLGRINVRCVRGADIRYVFKYVAKGPEDVPEWVARHRGRIRVFQASPRFYTRRAQREAKRSTPTMCLVRVDLFRRLGWDQRKALLVTVDHRGIRRVQAVKLRTTFNALLLMRAYESIHKRVQLAPPGVVNLSQHQAQYLKHEHRKFSALAGIPANAAAA